jgi:hypothetical protein
MIVVDVSASMDDPVSAATSKWEVTRIALTEAIATMPGSTLVGMLLYPNRQTTASDEPRPIAACVNVAGLVPVAPLSDPSMTQLDRLLSALWDDDVVDGGTPTHDAYIYALSALRVSVPEGPAHMLLITDGRPTFALGCVGTGRSEGRGRRAAHRPCHRRGARERDPHLRHRLARQRRHGRRRPRRAAMALARRLGGRNGA